MSRQLGDWLHSYLDYTEDSEAPEKFHLWVGLALLSAAVKRQVFLTRVKYKLYPNLYVLLVAESGMARKSASMEIGLPIFQEAVVDCPIISDASTPEGLIKFIHKASAISTRNGKINLDGFVMVHADELATLFSHDKIRAAKMGTLLTRCYTCPPKYDHTTARDDTLSIKAPYIVLLSATDPVNLKVIPEDVAVGGLLGRLIMVASGSRRRGRPTWSDDDEKSKDLKKALVNDLHEISLAMGEMIKTEAAMEVFDKWYDGLVDREQIEQDRRLKGFYSRCHDTAVKVAMLISLSRSSSLILEEGHMAGGIAFIEDQLPEIKRTIAWTGTSGHEQNRNKFMAILKDRGTWTPRKVLIKQMGLPLNEFDMLVLTLMAEGAVRKDDLPKVGTVYRGSIEELDVRTPMPPEMHDKTSS